MPAAAGTSAKTPAAAETSTITPAAAGTSTVKRQKQQEHRQ